MHADTCMAQSAICLAGNVSAVVNSFLSEGHWFQKAGLHALIGYGGLLCGFNCVMWTLKTAQFAVVENETNTALGCQ